MKCTHAYAASLVSVVVILVSSSAGQGVTGTPPFSSLGGGPFDVVNLGNLNVHFAIPVFSRAGRGMSFYYNLTYDNSIWTPVTVSGTTTWTPVAAWGWQSQTNGATGYIPSPRVTTGSCTYVDDLGRTVHGTTQLHTYSGFVDPMGTFHHVPGLAYETDTCGGGGASTTKTAADGSGYTVTVPDDIVTSRGGKVWNLQEGVGAGAAKVTDANGNQITTSNGTTFYDTLSSATAALTISGNAPNPVSYTYTSPAPPPANNQVSYTMNYLAYTVKTNFGVSNSNGLIQEYGPQTISLVSSIQRPDGTSYTFSYEQTPGTCTPNAGTQAQCTTGRISSVTLPTGGTITYSYSGGPNNTGIEPDGTIATLTRTLGGGQWQYVRSGSGTSWTTTVTDPNTNYTVLNFSGDGATIQNWYETERQVYQGGIPSTPTPCSLTVTSTCVLATTITCYNGVNVATPSSCPGTAVTAPIKRKTVFNYLPDSSGSQAETDTFYDSSGYGLVQQVDRYDFGSGGVGSKLNTMLITYGSYNSGTGTCFGLGNGILDRPCTVISEDGSGKLLAKTAYTYDQGTPTSTSEPQHIGITGSRGNLTTLTKWSSSTATLASTWTYYDTGAPNVATDVNNAQTTYLYGANSCNNSFADTIREPLTLSRSVVWNCVGGVATQVIDENGNKTIPTYTDPYFWRPASVQDPTNATTNFTYTPTTVDSKLAFNGTSSAVEQLTTVNPYGQAEYSQTSEGPGSPNWDTSQTNYDSLLRPYQVTMPCVATQGQGCPTAAKTTSTFDALGRVTQTTDGGTGYIKFSYIQNDVLQALGPAPSVPAVENLKQKELEYDGLGRLTKVCELTSAPGSGTCTVQGSPTGYLTTYAYEVNSSNNPTVTVTQGPSGSQQTRVYTYDLLGRLVSEQNPESGLTQYVYDTIAAPGICGGWTGIAGDLLQIVRAAGDWTCYEHDALHRLTAVGNSNQSTTNVIKEFRYDSSANGFVSPPSGATFANTAGRLIEAETDAGGKVTDEWFNYDVDGRLTDTYEYMPHSGGYYHVSSGYWANGALASLSSNIGGVPTESYSVDGMGRTSAVTASSGQNPVTSTSYNLSTYTNAVTFGTGDWDQFTFDPNTGRMSKYVYNVSTTPDTGTLTWNANGSLGSFQIQDKVPPTTSDAQTCSYTHDDLARIASVNCNKNGANTWNQNFTYDAFGNVTKTVPAGGTGISFQPGYSSSTNWITSLPGGLPQTDNDGQVTNDGVHSYGWDVYGELSTVDTSTTLTYDALGRMVEKNLSGTYTQFVYSPLGSKLGVMSGQTMQKAYIPLPGAEAVYTSTGLTYYRHGDYLGSSRLSTTLTHTRYAESAYAPFGEPYGQSGQTDAHFTGQDQDTVPGIYDFAYRKYNPTQGRWLSADPAGLAAVEPTNPQSWNRYAYVTNNPLALTDALGLFHGSGSAGYCDQCDLTFQPVYIDPFNLVNGACFMCGGPGGGGPDYGGGYTWTSGIGGLNAGGGGCGGADSAFGVSCGIICAPGWSIYPSACSDENYQLISVSTGGQRSKGSAKDPCTGVKASDLNYNIQQGYKDENGRPITQTGAQHIIEGHIFPGEAGNTMYAVVGPLPPGMSYSAAVFQNVQAYNAATFTFGSRTATEGYLAFSLSFPIMLNPYNGLPAFIGVDLYAYPVQPLSTNILLVSAKDCKTVRTSYPTYP